MTEISTGYMTAAGALTEKNTKRSFLPAIPAGVWTNTNEVPQRPVLDIIRVICYNIHIEGGGGMYAFKVMYNNIVMPGCAGQAVFG
jgi:hypothetical protein